MARIVPCFGFAGEGMPIAKKMARANPGHCVIESCKPGWASLSCGGNVRADRDASRGRSLGGPA